MTPTTLARFRAAGLAIAPAVILGGLLSHPWIGNPTDPDFFDRFSAAVIADTTHWAVSHLAVGVGSGLLALAFLGLAGRLREEGEERWSALGLPFIVMGSVLYGMLPAMEFAPVAAVELGADPGAAQAALFPWFIPILYTGAILFLLGSVGFALAIARSGLLERGPRRLVVAALLVAAACRFAPLVVIHFYVQSVAGVVALWPVAWVLWREGEGAPVRSMRPVAAPSGP